MRHPEDHALSLLTGWCALRIGEVLALCRRHVTQDRAGRVMLRIASQVQARGRGLYETAPKSAAGDREVYVPTVIRDALAEHLVAHVGADPDALPFPRGGGNQLNNPNTIRKRFYAAVALLSTECERVEMTAYTSFGFHDLRHTGMTRLG